MLDWLLAVSPILLVLVLMIRLRWSAARAGAAGWLAALAVAVVRFGAGLDLVAYSQAKSVLLTLDVLYIIWTALLLFEVAQEAGAVKAIGLALPRLTADRAMQALLMGWAFGSFLQGVGGFGVPIAVIAPLMIGLGFPPIEAVVIPSVGHAWSVTFGSLASSFQALMAATHLPGAELAPPAALLLGLAGFGCGGMCAHAAGGWAAVRRMLTPIGLIGLTMGGTQYLLAVAGLWNLAGFGAGMVGLVVCAFVARRLASRAGGAAARTNPGAATAESMEAASPASPSAGAGGREVILALSGYVVLILITVAIQLIAPIHEFFNGVVFRIQFPGIVTSLGFVTPAAEGRAISLFGHAGAILLYTAAFTYALYAVTGRLRRGAAGRIASATLHGAVGSSLGIATMVGAATVMAHSGMTDLLAQGLARGVGNGFPFAAPFIGALGAFMTGSNTNSNVVFAGLQMRTAQLLSISVPIILAGQTAGGAIGSILSPAKVVVGAGTAGLSGSEGAILRRLLPYGAMLILLLGLVTLAAVTPDLP